MIHAIVVDRTGFEPVAAQRERLASADSLVVVAPLTAEDWHAGVERVVTAAEHGDTIAVAALHALAPNGAGIVDAVARIGALGLELVAVDDEVDTREDPGFLAAAGLLAGAAEHAAEAGARRLLETAAARPAGVSPPQALYVPERFLGGGEGRR